MIRYTTPHGITVHRRPTRANYARGLSFLLKDLDRHRGIYLSSGYEYPGRYSRWDIGSTRPPLEIVSRNREVAFRPLNGRGEVLVRMFETFLRDHPHWQEFGFRGTALEGVLKPMPALFPEEERSKQPSVFSILRAVSEEFRNPLDSRLALIGLFGYDLLFQFEPIEKKLPRNGQKDLHLFLCDDIYFADRKREQINRYRYEFTQGDLTTVGLARKADAVPKPSGARAAGVTGEITSDHTPEEYMAKVETVREGMRQGDFYEVVLRQTFQTPYPARRASFLKRCSRRAPARMSFWCNWATNS